MSVTSRIKKVTFVWDALIVSTIAFLNLMTHNIMKIGKQKDAKKKRVRQIAASERVETEPDY